MRRIVRILHARPTIEGAGVHLKRVFGFGDTDLFDPFLLLDDFRSDEPEHYRRGFPWHPHRGIETITYMLKGSVEHGDSLGNRGVIEPGDVQWMTAGRGIIHQEMPEGDGTGSMHGFQLWANLPASQKMMAPRYREVKERDIPDVSPGNGVRIRVICGEAAGARGPVGDVVIDPVYLDVTVPPGTRHVHPTGAGHRVLAYIIGGRGRFCSGEGPFSYDAVGANYFDFANEGMLGNGTLVLYGDGDAIEVTTEDEGVRFLYISGTPIREPVAWRGPIVMNTREELQDAYRELEEGTFIKDR